MTGTELRELRQSLGLEQVALAYLVGCKQHHISRWESGAVKMSKRWTHRFTLIALYADAPEIQKKIAKAIVATY